MQEAKVEELEAQLQNAQADLKSGQKRIEQLHGALKDHEEEYSGDEDPYTSRSIGDSIDDRLDSEGSCSIGDDDSLGFSEDEEDEIVASSRNWGDRRSRELSPAAPAAPAVDNRRRKSASRDPEEEEFDAARKARQRRLQQLDEEEAGLEAARKARQDRLRNINQEEEEAGFEAGRKARQERLRNINQEEESRTDRQKELDFGKDRKKDRKSESPVLTSSVKHKPYEDEDDEDDDDLEEFLLRQKKRIAKLQNSDDDDDEEVGSIQAGRGAAARVSNEDLGSRGDMNKDGHVTNGVSKKSDSRERSEEPHVAAPTRTAVEKVDGPTTSRYRRKRQRRRTIEQLTSPEHAAKANGVDL